jgi:hypothetical protein
VNWCGSTERRHRFRTPCWKAIASPCAQSRRASCCCRGNLPFGAATQPIAPGAYVCNAQTLKSLRNRSVAAELPDAPNFRRSRHRLSPSIAATFQPAPPTPRIAPAPTFLGYPRSPARGVGTRNFIVLMGASSATGSFVRALEDRAPVAGARLPEHRRHRRRRTHRGQRPRRQQPRARAAHTRRFHGARQRRRCTRGRCGLGADQQRRAAGLHAGAWLPAGRRAPRFYVDSRHIRREPGARR